MSPSGISVSVDGLFIGRVVGSRPPGWEEEWEDESSAARVNEEAFDYKLWR